MSTNFEFIWNNWICPLVDDLQQQMDPNFISQCNVKIRDKDKIQINAEKYYQKKRRELKKTFYGEYEKGDSNDEHRMDFHKLAAIICRTLIEYKIFEFNVKKCQEYVENNIDKYDTDWVVKNALINFRLAFYASVVFLYQAMIYESSTNNMRLHYALRKKKKLDLYDEKQQFTKVANQQSSPATSNMVKESFENCIVLDLAKRDIGSRSFDYFMYSIIMYQLEEYNKQLLLKE